MNIKKHIIEQPFIFATGLAALIHSTWSLGTIFAGDQPTAGLTISFIGWLTPALLISFALDIGQIVTSAEIRAGERTRAKYLTFIIFALATYYLQWLYIAHHMPELALAGGVRPQWAEMVALMRDFAVWIVPALLPLSTALYTMSHGKTHLELVEKVKIDRLSEPHIDHEFLDDDEDTEPYVVVSQPAIIEGVKTEIVKKVVTAKPSNDAHCKNCGSVIALPRHNQKFCSKACRQEAYRKRQEVTS